MRKARKPTTAQIAREWDRAAPVRERQTSTGRDHSAIHVLGPAILRSLQSAEIERVLDVGCGTGWLSQLLAQKAGRVVGIDPSRVSIELARERHSVHNVQYERATVQAFARRHVWPFSAAVANMSLSTSANLKEVVRSVSRILQPRGVFIFTIPHPCYFPLYWEYATEPWFRYLDEVAIRAPFKIYAEKTRILTTHIHRPIQAYLNALSLAGFCAENVEELVGRGFVLPRFLLVRAVSAG